MISTPSSDFNKTQVLLWSHSQQAFHGSTIQQMLQSNLDSYFHQENHDSDWIVVGFSNTPQELADLRELLKKKMDEGMP